MLDIRRELRAIRQLPGAHIEQRVRLGRDVALFGILVHVEVPLRGVEIVAEGEGAFVVRVVAECFDVPISDAVPFAEKAGR